MVVRIMNSIDTVVKIYQRQVCIIEDIFHLESIIG